MTTTGTQAIDRAAELLSLVVAADEPQLQSTLVARTGLAKSTASRLLQALERHRLLYRRPEGSYEPGPLFALYATRHEPVDELTRLARPTLEDIGRITGETVNLAVVRGNAVVQVDQVDSTFLLSARDWVGVDVPAHCSALGKVFFAARAIAPPSSEKELPRLTSNTITAIVAFARELDRVRAQGYAVTHGELEIGLDAIAAPVYDRGDTVVAALGLSGPSTRIEEAVPELAALVVQQARTLSVLLGHDPASSVGDRQSRKKGAA